MISYAAPFDATLFHTALSLFLSAPLQKLRTYASKVKGCAPAGEEYPTNMATRQKRSLRLKLTGLVRALDSFEECMELPVCRALFTECGKPSTAWFSYLRLQNLNRWALALSREQIHPSLNAEEP